jgi:hypothetical protein
VSVAVSKAHSNQLFGHAPGNPQRSDIAITNNRELRPTTMKQVDSWPMIRFGKISDFAVNAALREQLSSREIGEFTFRHFDLSFVRWNLFVNQIIAAKFQGVNRVVPFVSPEFEDLPLGILCRQKPVASAGTLCMSYLAVVKNYNLLIVVNENVFITEADGTAVLFNPSVYSDLLAHNDC